MKVKHHRTTTLSSWMMVMSLLVTTISLLQDCTFVVAVTDTTDMVVYTYADPDCTDVTCREPNCKERRGPNFIAVDDVPGRCCPLCVFDNGRRRRNCDSVRCDNPSCDDTTQIAYTPPTRCCPKCYPRGRLGPLSIDQPAKKVLVDTSSTATTKNEGGLIIVKKPDCTVVRCGTPPSCEYGYEPYTPPDGCCPTSCQLKSNCDVVNCIRAPCPPICTGEDNSSTTDPNNDGGGDDGGTDPVDCSLVLCAMPLCIRGYELVTLPGSCCPSCQPPSNSTSGGNTGVDCSMINCAAPVCEDGYEIVTVSGSCCPTCQPIDDGSNNQVDCSLVRCAMPICEYGYEAITKPGSCCPTCQLKSNCEIVQCIQAPCPPICTDESTPAPAPIIVQKDCSDIACIALACDSATYLAPDACCPSCVDECTKDMICANTCLDGLVQYTPPGYCCPICILPDPITLPPECAAVQCLALQCDNLDEYVYTVPGECCPSECRSGIDKSNIYDSNNNDTSTIDPNDVCPMVKCADPCNKYNYETDTSTPVCGETGTCITKMSYMEIGKKKCPMCLQFIECKIN